MTSVTESELPLTLAEARRIIIDWRYANHPGTTPDPELPGVLAGQPETVVQIMLERWHLTTPDRAPSAHEMRVLLDRVLREDAINTRRANARARKAS